MNRQIINTLILCLMIAFHFNGIIHAQSIEVSDRFRQVAQKLVKAKFKNVVFDELKASDQILAASSYDLIDRVTSGDSLSEIKTQILISIFDYIGFVNLRDVVQEVFPKDSIYSKSGEGICAEDYGKLMNLSTLVIYEYLGQRDLMVVSGGIVKMLEEYSDFIGSFRPLKQDMPRAQAFSGSLKRLIRDQEASILKAMRFNLALKNITVSLSKGDSINASLILEFNNLTGKTYEINKQILPVILDTVKYYLLRIRQESTKSYGKLYSDLYVIISPYVRSIIFQKIDQQPIDYGRQMLIAFTEKLESIYNSKKSGFKYKIGLWSGIFVSGPIWDPPTTTYPILSLRINDRLQYTFNDSGSCERFAYIGGFSDVLIKELSNKSTNQFGYIGCGLGFKAFAITVSAAIPINKDMGDVGFVFSLMYDLPLNEIFD